LILPLAKISTQSSSQIHPCLESSGCLLCVIQDGLRCRELRLFLQKTWTSPLLADQPAFTTPLSACACGKPSPTLAPSLKLYVKIVCLSNSACFVLSSYSPPACATACRCTRLRRSRALVGVRVLRQQRPRGARCFASAHGVGEPGEPPGVVHRWRPPAPPF